MYIRRTKVKGGPRGEVYITHRLVESVRTEKGVRQRTLLNLAACRTYRVTSCFNGTLSYTRIILNL